MAERLARGLVCTGSGPGVKRCVRWSDSCPNLNLEVLREQASGQKVKLDSYLMERGCDGPVQAPLTREQKLSCQRSVG